MTPSPAISIDWTLLRHQQRPTSLVPANSAWCNPDPVSIWFHMDTHAVRTRCLPWAVDVLSAGHPHRWLCICTSDTLRTNAFAWNVHRDLMLSHCFSQHNWIICSFCASVTRLFCFALLYERCGPSVPPALFLVLLFPVLHFPALWNGPAFSGPAISGFAFSSI